MHHMKEEIATFEIAATKLAMLLSRYYNDNLQHFPLDVATHVSHAMTQAATVHTEMMQAARKLNAAIEREKEHA